MNSMIQFKKPMLAASLMPSNIEHTNANILDAMSKLRYPVLATLKKDGIRAIKVNGHLVSRTLKSIPNDSIRFRARKLPDGFDMELWNEKLAYEEIESIVMSKEHERSDEIQFHVLDQATDLKFIDYSERYYTASIKTIFHDEMKREYRPKDVVFDQPCYCRNAHELFDHFIWNEQKGAEGICFRTPNSPYKQGRSTLREQYLVKLCRNLTSEAIVLDFLEQQENTNPSSRNAVGAMDRSSCKHNLVGKNTLGALVVRDVKSNLEFKIGTGFDDKKRREIWSSKEQWKDKIITYKYKGGGKDLPRCAVFLRERKMV